jgi:hypothetical protein
MNAELKANYPLINENCGLMRMEHTILATNELLTKANQIATDDDEVAYLKSLEDFIDDVANKQKKQIKNKLDMMERVKKFDMINFIKYLPYDMVYTIKKYLEPELTYTKKFSILRHIDSGFSWWRDVDEYLFKVPKKLLVNCFESCAIHPSMSVASKDQKERWCRMIVDETQKLFSKKKDMMRIDKLLANRDAEWSCDPKLKVIDKWYKFFLYIHTFKKYRAELEGKVKKTDAKITLLKNKKIVVKLL